MPPPAVVIELFKADAATFSVDVAIVANAAHTGGDAAVVNVYHMADEGEPKGLLENAVAILISSSRNNFVEYCTFKFVVRLFGAFNYLEAFKQV